MALTPATRFLMLDSLSWKTCHQLSSKHWVQNSTSTQDSLGRTLETTHGSTSEIPGSNFPNWRLPGASVLSLVFAMFKEGTLKTDFRSQQVRIRQGLSTS